MTSFVRGAALAVGVLAGAVGCAGAAGFPVDEERGGMPTFAPVLARVLPSVVNINTLSPVQVRSPAGLEQRLVPSSASGIVVDAERGYILTNHHVVAGASWMGVALADGRMFEAKVVGSDAATDIGVLKIVADNLKQIPRGRSADVRVGDIVVAVGNPFGLGQTATMGMVSALARRVEVEGVEDYIQTDAALNPGNSGGALIDVTGALIGISAAIIGPRANVGIGFAVPIDLARLVMDQLIKYGSMQRPAIGMDVVDVTPDVAAAVGTTGAAVHGVRPASAAAGADLRVGDVIHSFNGVAVRDASDLVNRFGTTRVGDRVRLGIARGTTRLEVHLDLNEPRAVALAPVQP